MTAEAEVWAVHTTGYTYELLLADGSEIIAYHYHPSGVSPVKTPHLHACAFNAPFPLGKAHIPTGRVPIEAVLRFAITEIEVEPRRADWDTILARGEGAFDAQRR